MNRVRFHPAARDELEEATRRYERDVAGLGNQFYSQVVASLTLLRAFPYSAPVLSGDLRRQVLPRFPYNLIYEVWDGDFLYVIAVAHQKRRPGYWSDRR